MPTAAELGHYGTEITGSLWRVSLKRYTPFAAPPPHSQTYGRFDDPAEEGNSDVYSVLYCASSSYASFIEAMGGLRIRLGVENELLKDTLIPIEEREAISTDYGSAGRIPNDWRTVNQLTSGHVVTRAPLFDLTRADAVQALRYHLAPSLIALGIEDLDFGNLLGTDRNLTQAISRWIWTMTNDAGQPLFAGIRYRSRFDPESICIAMYENRFEIDGEIDILSITSQTPGFAEAASTLRLHIA